MYKSSTSPEKYVEMKVSFDNLMMIAYSRRVNLVENRIFPNSANSFTFKGEGKHGMRLSQG